MLFVLFCHSFTLQSGEYNDKRYNLHKGFETNIYTIESRRDASQCNRLYFWGFFRCYRTNPTVLLVFINFLKGNNLKKIMKNIADVQQY